jgi:hypothetical protein
VDYVSPEGDSLVSRGTVLLLALNQVETAALWIGVITGVASIVLSIIAILFARDVDRWSGEVSNQTIRSLENIQATVQRLSEDTGSLIKVAWDRMLGTMERDGGSSRQQLQAVLSGLLAEFGQEAEERAPGRGMEELARSIGRRVQKAGDDATQFQGETPSSGGAFDAAVTAINSMSPLAIELLRALVNSRHLTRVQYRRLSENPEMAEALEELRERQILVPLQGHGKEGKGVVYWLSPWFADVVGPALVFTGHETPSAAEADRIEKALVEYNTATR